MPLFERVTIAGVGLIGGSLGGAAKAAGLFGEVVGFGRSQSNLELACQRGLIDRFDLDAERAASGANLLLLAIPVQAMAAVVRAAVPKLAANAIVSDVGSVKADVVRTVEAVLPAGVPFVGAHPIAGGEETGAAAADAELFRGSECIVTPGSSATPTAIEKIRALWQGVGMRVATMTPEEHDRALAWVSHLPHALAFALVRAVVAGAPEAVPHGGPSLSEMSRIAASSPEMWRDIFLANRRHVLEAIGATISQLQGLHGEIETGDAESVRRWIEQSRAGKAQWPAKARAKNR